MSKELLSTLGLCKRAGMLEAGEDPLYVARRVIFARLRLMSHPRSCCSCSLRRSNSLIR